MEGSVSHDIGRRNRNVDADVPAGRAANPPYRRPGRCSRAAAFFGRNKVKIRRRHGSQPVSRQAGRSSPKPQ
jgi:hypothetical protein